MTHRKFKTILRKDLEIRALKVMMHEFLHGRKDWKKYVTAKDNGSYIDIEFNLMGGILTIISAVKNDNSPQQLDKKEKKYKFQGIPKDGLPFERARDKFKTYCNETSDEEVLDILTLFVACSLASQDAYRNKKHPFANKLSKQHPNPKEYCEICDDNEETHNNNHKKFLSKDVIAVSDSLAAQLVTYDKQKTELMKTLAYAQRPVLKKKSQRQAESSSSSSMKGAKGANPSRSRPGTCPWIRRSTQRARPTPTATTLLLIRSYDEEFPPLS